MKATMVDSIHNLRTVRYTHNAIVAKNDCIVANGNVLVALTAQIANVEGTYAIMGRMIVTKATGIVMTVGDKIYFDVADDNVNKSASGNTQCGICYEGAGSSATEIEILLLPNAGVYPTLSSHYVFAAGLFTTVGGDANETITIAGLLATDIAICTLAGSGGTARTILTSKAASGQIDVVMSGDPSTVHQINYIVLRGV